MGLDVTYPHGSGELAYLTGTGRANKEEREATP